MIPADEHLRSTSAAPGPTVSSSQRPARASASFSGSPMSESRAFASSRQRRKRVFSSFPTSYRLPARKIAAQALRLAASARASVRRPRYLTQVHRQAVRRQSGFRVRDSTVSFACGSRLVADSGFPRSVRPRPLLRRSAAELRPMEATRVSGSGRSVRHQMVSLASCQHYQYKLCLLVALRSYFQLGNLYGISPLSARITRHTVESVYPLPGEGAQAWLSGQLAASPAGATGEGGGGGHQQGGCAGAVEVDMDELQDASLWRETKDDTSDDRRDGTPGRID